MVGLIDGTSKGEGKVMCKTKKLIGIEEVVFLECIYLHAILHHDVFLV